MSVRTPRVRLEDDVQEGVAEEKGSPPDVVITGAISRPATAMDTLPDTNQPLHREGEVPETVPLPLIPDVPGGADLAATTEGAIIPILADRDIRTVVATAEMANRFIKSPVIAGPMATLGVPPRTPVARLHGVPMVIELSPEAPSACRERLPSVHCDTSCRSRSHWWTG